LLEDWPKVDMPRCSLDQYFPWNSPLREGTEASPRAQDTLHQKISP